MRTAFINTLCELAAVDGRIWLLTGDLGYSVLERFRDAFPQRFINVGVAEQNMMGVAAGLARCGKVVFTYSIANFPTLRCLEQIRNDVCYHNGNVKIIAVGGGYAYGPQGYTHHGLEELAVLRALPNMTVVAPGDPTEARLATQAIARHDGPCYVRLGKAGEPIVHPTEPAFELGQAIVARPGDDITLIATGSMLKDTLAAAERLSGVGVSARVLSMHTLKPLDADAVCAAASETAAILTVEEHSITGGLGSAVADVLAAFDDAHPRFAKLGTPDRVCHRIGSQAYLRASADDIFDRALELSGAASAPPDRGIAVNVTEQVPR